MFGATMLETHDLSLCRDEEEVYGNTPTIRQVLFVVKTPEKDFLHTYSRELPQSRVFSGLGEKGRQALRVQRARYR